MMKHVNVMVLLAIIMCTNFISCNSNPNQELKAFDLSHAKKVNVSIEEMNPKIEPLNILDDTGSYHNGLKSFEKNGLYGFVDQNNNVVIDPQYKYVQEFYNENRAIVSPDGKKYGVINRNGSYVIMPQFDNIMALTLNSGIYRVEYDGEVGIIDSTGENVVKYGKYDDIDYCGFYGFVKVRKENKWGFVDINGMEIVNPQYDDIELPLDTEGFAAVRINNNWGLIDLNGNVIIPIEHKQASCTGEKHPAQIFPFEGMYDREIVWFDIYKDGTVIAKTIPKGLLKK